MTIEGTPEDRVRQLATARRLSAQGIMREALQQYVAREDQRESFQQEARASWAAYETSGRHLTGTEVETWLDTWGMDTQADGPPECHE